WGGDTLEARGLGRITPVPCPVRLEGRLTPGTCPGAPGERTPPEDLSPLQRTLWDALAAEPRHVDALTGVANTPTADVLTALTELELRGVVRQEAGMRFALN